MALLQQAASLGSCCDECTSKHSVPNGVCQLSRHYSGDSVGAETLLCQVQEENESLRNQLLVMESQVGSFSGKMSQLHTLLQDSCKREWTLLDNRRKHAEEQMTRAQKVVSSY